MALRRPYGQTQLFGPPTEDDTTRLALAEARQGRSSSALLQGVDMYDAALTGDSLQQEALAAEQAGDMGRAQGLRRRAEVEYQRAAILAPDVQRVEDINGVGDAVTYGLGQLGGMARTMGPAIGAGMVGGLVGGPVGAALGAGRGLRTAAELASFFNRGAAVGRYAGAAGASYDQLRGEAVAAQYADPDVAQLSPDERASLASGTAALSTIPEMIVPGRLAGALRPGLGARAARTLENALVEGGTEALQQEIGYQGLQAGGSQAERELSDYVNSFAAGAIGGGGLSTVFEGVGAGLDASEEQLRAGGRKIAELVTQGKDKAVELAQAGKNKAIDLAQTGKEKLEDTGLGAKAERLYTDLVGSHFRKEVEDTVTGAVKKVFDPDLVARSVSNWMDNVDGVVRNPESTWRDLAQVGFGDPIASLYRKIKTPEAQQPSIANAPPEKMGEMLKAFDASLKEDAEAAANYILDPQNEALFSPEVRQKVQALGGQYTRQDAATVTAYAVAAHAKKRVGDVFTQLLEPVRGLKTETKDFLNKKLSLQNIPLQQIQPVVQALSGLFGSSARDLDIPTMARELVAFQSRLNDRGASNQELETLMRLNTELGMFDPDDTVLTAFKQLQQFNPNGLASSLEKVRRMATATQDVMTSGSNSFLASRLPNAEALTPDNLAAIAGRVDEISLGYDNYSDTRKRNAMATLAPLFGGKEQAKVVLTYYGEMRRAQMAAEAAGTETAAESADPLAVFDASEGVDTQDDADTEEYGEGIDRSFQETGEEEAIKAGEVSATFRNLNPARPFLVGDAWDDAQVNDLLAKNKDALAIPLSEYMSLVGREPNVVRGEIRADLQKRYKNKSNTPEAKARIERELADLDGPDAMNNYRVVMQPKSTETVSAEQFDEYRVDGRLESRDLDKSNSFDRTKIKIPMKKGNAQTVSAERMIIKSRGSGSEAQKFMSALASILVHPDVDATKFDWKQLDALSLLSSDKRTGRPELTLADARRRDMVGEQEIKTGSAYKPSDEERAEATMRIEKLGLQPKGEAFNIERAAKAYRRIHFRKREEKTGGDLATMQALREQMGNWLEKKFPIPSEADVINDMEHDGFTPEHEYADELAQKLAAQSHIVDAINARLEFVRDVLQIDALATPLERRLAAVDDRIKDLTERGARTYEEDTGFAPGALAEQTTPATFRGRPPMPRKAIDQLVAEGKAKLVDGVYYINDPQGSPFMGGITKTGKVYVNLGMIKASPDAFEKYLVDSPQKKLVMERLGLDPKLLDQTLGSVKRKAAFVRDHELSHIKNDDAKNYPRDLQKKLSLLHPKAIEIEARAVRDALSDDEFDQSRATLTAASRLNRAIALTSQAIDALKDGGSSPARRNLEERLAGLRQKLSELPEAAASENLSRAETTLGAIKSASQAAEKLARSAAPEVAASGAPKGDSFEIVALPFGTKREGVFDGHRAGPMNVTNAKPGAPGALGNPFVASDVRGSLSRKDAVAKFKEAFLKRVNNDPAYRNWVLSLRGKQVGYYKPNEADIHLHVVQEWLAAQPEAPKAETSVQADASPINVYWGTRENQQFSNLAERPFRYEGNDYVSVEHAYQTLKSGRFDKATFAAYKGAGKITGKFPAKTEGGWNVGLMQRLVYESFKQNPEAAKALLATGDRQFTHTQDKGIWRTEFPKALAAAREKLRSEPNPNRRYSRQGIDIHREIYGTEPQSLNAHEHPVGEEFIIPVTHDSPHKVTGRVDWEKHKLTGEGTMYEGAGFYVSTSEGSHRGYKSQFAPRNAPTDKDVIALNDIVEELSMEVERLEKRKTKLATAPFWVEGQPFSSFDAAKEYSEQLRADFLITEDSPFFDVFAAVGVTKDMLAEITQAVAKVKKDLQDAKQQLATAKKAPWLKNALTAEQRLKMLERRLAYLQKKQAEVEKSNLPYWVHDNGFSDYDEAFEYASSLTEETDSNVDVNLRDDLLHELGVRIEESKTEIEEIKDFLERGGPAEAFGAGKSPTHEFSFRAKPEEVLGLGPLNQQPKEVQERLLKALKPLGFFVSTDDPKGRVSYRALGWNAAIKTGDDVRAFLTQRLDSDVEASKFLRDEAGFVAIMYPSQRKSNSKEPNYVILDGDRLTQNYVHFNKQGGSSQTPSGKPMTPAEQQLVRNEFARLRGLGGKAQLKFENINGASGYWEDVGAQGRIIAIALNAAGNGLGVVRHEAMHDLFNMLRSSQHRALLLRAANDKHVVDQLKKLLAGDQNALDQISEDNPDHMEERLAYAYQFWADNALTLKKPVHNFFQKIATFIRGLFKAVSEGERANDIFAMFHRGDLKDPNTADIKIAGARQKTARELLEKNAPLLVNTMDKVFTAAIDRLHSFGSSALSGLAPKFEEFLRNRFRAEGIFMNRLNDIFKTAKREELQLALERAQAMAPDMNNPLDKAIRELLDDLFEYVNRKGVKQRDGAVLRDIRYVKNYFPRFWDTKTIAENEQEFKALLAKHKLTDDPDSTVDTLMSGEGKIELKEDYYDHFTFTPWMQGMTERGLRIKPAFAAEFSKFQSKDITEILSTYVEQTVHRAEFVAAFDNEGTKIEEALKRTPAGKFDDAQQVVKALLGTLNANELSPGMRSLMSAAMTAQNVILLPLAIFSQAIDPLLISMRTGRLGDAFTAYKTALQQLVGRGKDAKKLAQDLGIVSEETALQAMGQTYGSMYMSKRMQNINRRLFKWNGMALWNQSMRTAATVMGLRYLNENKNNAEALAEVGLKPADLAGFDPKSAQQSLKVQKALFQFVDQAVVRPSAAHRPVWMSDPKFMLLGHLKQFTFSMHKVVLERMGKEVDKGNYKPLMMMALATPFMLASDLAKWTLTGSVPDSWTWGDYLSHAVQRSGALGKFQFGVDAIEDMDHNKLPGTSFLGPTAEHLLLLLRFATGNATGEQVIDRSLPLVKYF